MCGPADDQGPTFTALRMCLPASSQVLCQPSVLSKVFACTVSAPTRQARRVPLISVVQERDASCRPSWGCGSGVEHLTSMLEVLGSIPSTAPKTGSPVLNKMERSRLLQPFPLTGPLVRAGPSLGRFARITSPVTVLPCVGAARPSPAPGQL